jgi:hypothetical protein
MTTTLPPFCLAALEAIAEEWCRIEATDNLSLFPTILKGTVPGPAGEPLNVGEFLEVLIPSDAPLPFSLRVRHGPYLDFSKFANLVVKI